MSTNPAILIATSASLHRLLAQLYQHKQHTIQVASVTRSPGTHFIATE